MKKSILPVLLVFVLVLSLMPAAAFAADGDANGDGYHDGDVAVINSMIDNNGLPFTKNDPASWPAATAATATGDTYVEWSTDSPKRIVGLYVFDFDVSGSVDLTALTNLEYVRFWETSVSALDLTGLTAVDHLSVGLPMFTLTSYTNAAGSTLTLKTAGSGTGAISSLGFFDIPGFGEGLSFLATWDDKDSAFSGWTTVPAGSKIGSEISEILQGEDHPDREILIPFGLHTNGDMTLEATFTAGEGGNTDGTTSGGNTDGTTSGGNTDGTTSGGNTDGTTSGGNTGGAASDGTNTADGKDDVPDMGERDSAMLWIIAAACIAACAVTVKHAWKKD